MCIDTLQRLLVCLFATIQKYSFVDALNIYTLCCFGAIRWPSYGVELACCHQRLELPGKKNPAANKRYIWGLKLSSDPKTRGL